MKPNYNIAFVGGCFTEQENISPLYHETVIKQLFNKNIEAEKTIIRYENISTCFEKIKNNHHHKKISLLVFHLRPESIIKQTKFCIKYIDNSNKLHYFINLPVLNGDFSKINHTKSLTPPNSNSVESESFLNYVAREFNYISGYILGNWNYSMKQYLDLVEKIIDFCAEKNIKLLVIGSVPRPKTFFENRIAKYINTEFILYNKNNDINYLDCFTQFDTNGNYIFFKKMFVNQYGHDVIGKKIAEKILKIISVTSPHLLDGAELAQKHSLKSKF